MTVVNDNLILVCGRSSAGKSMSLESLKNHKGVMYLNCESGKKLPFKNKFRRMTITDPYDIYDAFDLAEEMGDEIHTIVIDSATYMMEMFESVHVVTSSNTMAAWGDYAQFFKNLMQDYVAKSTKNVIMTAHVADVLNEKEGVMETMVKVKGSLMNNGIESYFSNIVMAKRMTVKELRKLKFENPMLDITEDDEFEGVKYVFQTKHTASTANERIRSPRYMWARNETLIDNNIQSILDRSHEYYTEDEDDDED